MLAENIVMPSGRTSGFGGRRKVPKINVLQIFIE